MITINDIYDCVAANSWHNNEKVDIMMKHLPYSNEKVDIIMKHLT